MATTIFPPFFYDLPNLDFDDVHPFESVIFDPEMARDPAQLLRFIKTCYTNKNTWETYQNMITEAIKAQNIQGLDILWAGTYYYGESPVYLSDLMTAAQYGTSDMFKHVLYAYFNFHSMTHDLINYDELMKIPKNDPTINEIIFYESKVKS